MSVEVQDEGGYVVVQCIGLRRKLNVTINRAHREVRVALFPPERKGSLTHMIAYASANQRDDGAVRLCDGVEKNPPCLWLGRAAFDLTDAEAKAIRQLLEPPSYDLMADLKAKLSEGDAR